MSGQELALFHAGDEGFFRHLVESTSPALRRFVGGYVADLDAVEDVLQDVWVAVFLKRRSFRGAASLMNWIYSIARNRCLSILRRTNLEQSCAWAVIAPIDQPSPLEMVEFTDTMDRFQTALRMLPSRQREVLHSRVTRQESTRETATALACSERAVKSALFHARRYMRRALMGERASAGRPESSHYDRERNLE
jgi:RNA polymerase sigma-70 factor (ECF subfamily)